MKANERKNGLHGMAQKSLLWLLPLLLLIVFTVNGCLPFPIGRHKCTDENALAKFEEAVLELYPASGSAPVDLVTPPEIGEPSKTEFHSYRTNMVIFESSAYTLLCSYGDEEYAAAKAAVEARYSFRTEPLYSKDPTFSKDAKELDPEFVIGGDHFRFILPSDEVYAHEDFFKNCFIVVTNDAERQIAYIVYRDIDLDVADDMTEFVRDTCGWRYVR